MNQDAHEGRLRYSSPKLPYALPYLLELPFNFITFSD